MFQKRTVFIVGAGGSVEFGMPAGNRLKDIIALKTTYTTEQGQRKSGDWEVLDAVHGLNQHLSSVGFITAGRALAQAMPISLSIDNYLHAQAGDEYAVAIGKMAIAASIMEAESHTPLVVENHEDLNFSKLSPSWHSVFFQMASEGLDRGQADSVFDNVSIITFNYDRCIEHYLSHAVRMYFKLTPEDAQNIVKNMSIFHVYGQVGKLPWQTARGQVPTPYGTKPDSTNLPHVAPLIKTFTESEVDHEKQDAIRRAIGEAEVVVFLGFSFGRINLEYLQLAEEGVPKNVLASAYGLSEENRDAIRRALNNMLSPVQEWPGEVRFSNDTCVDFLSRHWWEIVYA